MLKVSESKYECIDFEECVDFAKTYIILGIDFTVEYDDVLKKWVITLINSGLQ